MASQTLSGALWPDGTTVGVYPAVAVPAGSDVPSGQTLTTGVVSGGSVSFAGLAERVRYYAYGGGKGVRFLIPATSKEGDRARIEDLESRVDTVEAGEGSFVSVRSYGATGLGLADETAGLQAALNAAAGEILVVPDGVYLHGPLTVRSGTTVRCAAGAVFKPQTNASAILFDSPTLRTPSTSYQTTVDTVVGAVTVTVSAADAANFAAGDRVTLRDATYTLGGENVKREMNVVESVNTGTGVITLAHPLGHVYTAANDSWIAKVVPARDIHWIGGQADCDAQAGGIAADVDFIEALYPENCTVEGLTVYNHPDKAISFYGGLSSHIRDCNGYSPDLVAAGEGYTSTLGYCRDCTIEGGWSRNVRHHADISGGQSNEIIGGFATGRTTDFVTGAFLHGMESRWCSIRGFTAENVDTAAQAGVSTFAGDFEFLIEDVLAVGCTTSINAYKSTGQIVRPKVRNPLGVALTISDAGTDVEVVDPDIDMGTLNARAMDASSLTSVSQCKLRGGRIKMSHATPIAVRMSALAGAVVSVEDTYFSGTMANCVAMTGGSTDQTVRGVKCRGVISEQVRFDNGEAIVTDCDFAPSGSTVAIRAATSTTKITQEGNAWGGATTRVSNTSSAVTVGTTKIDTEGTAAPTTGTWAVGDRCWNTAATVGGILGWVCVTAGTPGTWTTFYTSTGSSSSSAPRVATVVASFYATTAEKAGADAVCDGVDDQVEIQAAIDAIKATTPGAGVAGGVVRLVGPRFNTSNSIVLKSYIWLEGDGWFMTEIKSQSTWNGAASSGIISLDNTGGTTATEYTTLRNLTVNPNKFVQTTVAVRGLNYVVDATTGWTYNDSTQTVEYVRVIDSSDDGIRLSGANQRGCYFNNIRIERCALYGFRTDCADSHFHNMNIGGSGLAGVFVNGATNHRFTNCKVWFSGGTNGTTGTTALATQSAGYRVEGPRNSFVACEAQDNRGHGFSIGSDHNTFAGCVADSNSWATANANVGNADGFYIANDVHFVTLQGIAFDKNETNRGIAQRNGVRISTSTPLASNLIVDVAVDACQGGPYSGQASGYPQSRINVTGRGFGGRGSITTTSGSPTVTVNSTAQGAFANGDVIRSSLLPGGTSGGSAKITAGGGTATLTLDQNATATGTGTAVSGPLSARGVRAGAALTSTPGAVTTLAIPHGLGVAPVIYDARPGDAFARGAPAYHVTADATNVTLNFASALTAATAYTWIWDAVA